MDSPASPDRKIAWLWSAETAIFLAAGVSGCGSWAADILAHPLAALAWRDAWFSISSGIIQFLSLFIALRLILHLLKRPSVIAERACGLAIAIAVPIRLLGLRLYESAFVSLAVSWAIPLFVFALVILISLAFHYRIARRQGGLGLTDLSSIFIPTFLTAWLATCLAVNFGIEALQDLRNGIYSVIIFMSLLLIGWIGLYRHSGRLLVRAALTLICSIVLLLCCVVRLSERISDAMAWRALPDGAEPHLMLLTADTLRADGPQFMNPVAHETPAMDSIASDGFVFRNAASAAPWTIPSFAAIMTGQTPAVHGVVHMNRKLSERFDTLAERLRARGYRTEAHVMNAFLRPEHQLDQGFERYNYLDLKRPDLQWNLVTHLASLWPASYWNLGPNDRMLCDVRRFLERRSSRPFFLWVHFLDPHWPLAPTDESLSRITKEPLNLRTFSPDEKKNTYTAREKREIQILYRAEILDLDMALGKVLDSLKRRGLFDDLMLAFTSDHGEAFWEHRGYGHGFALYQEQVHVPFVLRLGADGPVGETDQPVSNARLFATFLDLAGIPPKDELMESQTVLPLAKGEESGPIPVYSSGVSDKLPEQHALRLDHQKLILTDNSVARRELYDLRSDPGEKSDLSAINTQDLEKNLSQLEALLIRQQALVESFNLDPAEITLELDEGDIADLQAIGYFE